MTDVILYQKFLELVNWDKSQGHQVYMINITKCLISNNPITNCYIHSKFNPLLTRSLHGPDTEADGFCHENAFRLQLWVTQRPLN